MRMYAPYADQILMAQCSCFCPHFLEIRFNRDSKRERTTHPRHCWRHLLILFLCWSSSSERSARRWFGAGATPVLVASTVLVKFATELPISRKSRCGIKSWSRVTVSLTCCKTMTHVDPFFTIPFTWSGSAIYMAYGAFIADGWVLRCVLHPDTPESLRKTGGC